MSFQKMIFRNFGKLILENSTFHGSSSGPQKPVMELSADILSVFLGRSLLLLGLEMVALYPQLVVVASELVLQLLV